MVVRGFTSGTLLKLLIAVVAVAMGMMGLASPASATESAAAVASCASPPDSPDATAANRERYVDLWSARMADSAWLKNFTKLDAVPAEIEAEGFHDMDGQTQIWLNACLLDDMLATAGETPTDAKRNKYLSGLNLVIFGKAGIAKMRERLAAEAPVKLGPAAPEELTGNALDEMADGLVSEPSLTPADQPKSDADTPTPSTTTNLEGQASPELKKLLDAPAMVPTTSTPQAPAATADPEPLIPDKIIGLPLVPQVLEAVAELLELISSIQGQLFTLPVLNPLASLFYKICAESPTMPLSCSVSVPVGVFVPADVTGDNFPDVLVKLAPMSNLTDVGARLLVQRLATAPVPLKAHVFAVYDTPFVKKRVEFGFDGRASTLAKQHNTTFVLKNVLKTVTTGDVEVQAAVESDQPGSTESMTFAVKDLVGGSSGVPAAEENPLTGAAQLSPFPASFTAGAHLTHTNVRSEDVFTVASSTPSKVNAVIDQKTTTTTPKSSRRFTAEVDKLPTKVVVDLVRNGENQSIDYSATAPIDSVSASDRTTPDVGHPGSFTESIYAVKGVPDKVHVDLKGAQDITYSASAKIPEVSFSTRTLADDVLQQQVNAKAHQVPKSVHVTNLTSADQTAVTYDADDVLQDVELGMFDLDDDKTNLVAKATGIPTHLQFTQTKSTGVYDFSADNGIGLIEASLTRNDGLLLPLAGDHATVYKRENALGLDFRLSGFKSAHFDGSEDTTVELGLSPGGQSFDAVADLDDPNVLAKAHVSKLPANMKVTLDPADGAATYQASSIIPLLRASFTDRDTEMFAKAELTDLPKNIALAFNTSGAVPEVTYDADSRLGSIDVTYSEKPGGLALHGLISDLPPYLKIGGIDPIVFDARNASFDAPGSSYLGQVFFQYATDGTFASPPTTDDHVYLDTDEVASTHAELQYTGLKLLSVDTSDQELHAEIRNSAARMLRAYLTTPNLTLTGFIDKVPSQINIDQVGNLVSYAASSSIAEIYTNLHRTVGDDLAVDITGVPSSIDLLFDGTGSKLEWDASGATGGVSALAHLTPATLASTRAFDASLALASIPAEWDASWVNGNVVFNAPDSIGSIAAKVTNHGAYNTLPGDHLHAFFDQPSGDLDASLRISKLRKVAFTKLTNANGGGFDAELRMGDNGTLSFGADITLTASKLKALGAFTQLPSILNLRSDGGRITYNGNTNPDLTLSVEAGTAAALAATPTPNSVHGVSVRDGQANGAKAVKAKLRLTGLPTSLDLNSPAGTYSVNGYHPTEATLVVDAVLTALAPQPLSLQVQQVVPTASPVDFTFGPFLTSTAGDGTHNLSLSYTASQTLGALTAEATYGNTDDAKLEISSIPSSINVNAGFGADQKTVGIAMSSGISDITASYKKVGALNFAASVHLHDVPSAVNLVIGRGTASGGGKEITAPDFTMTASQPGLDIDATASAAIATPADIKAAVNLQVTNLGHTVTGALDGTSLHITSTPATGSFLLVAAGVVNMDFNLDFEESGFTNDGQLDVAIDVKQLTLGFQNSSDLVLDLGITTGLRGDFSNFTFGLDTDTEIHIYDNLDFFIDWPDPFGTSTIDLFFIDEDIDFDNVIDGFHINTNTFGEVFDIPFFFFVIGECSVNFLFRPGPGFTTPSSTLSLPAPPDDGVHTPAWLITPDVTLLGFSLPDFALDIIAWFASPYGHGFDVDAGCETYL
jgi:hypothetical protein